MCFDDWTDCLETDPDYDAGTCSECCRPLTVDDLPPHSDRRYQRICFDCLETDERSDVGRWEDVTDPDDC